MTPDELAKFVADAARVQRFAESRAQEAAGSADRVWAGQVVRQVKGLRKMLGRWARHTPASTGTILRSS